MIYILGFFFLLFEGVISNFVPYFSYSFTIQFSFFILFYLFFLFFHREYRYLWFGVIAGVFYDLSYTSWFIYHAIFFTVLGFAYLKLLEHTDYPFLSMLLVLLGGFSLHYFVYGVLQNYVLSWSTYFLYLLQFVLSNSLFFLLGYLLFRKCKIHKI